jgi:hypothetical protein
VLGPLPHQKVVDLVARGQITGEQEMSSDGVNWAKASDFSTFFPAAAQPAAEPAQESAVSNVPVAVLENWYVGFEGEAPRAYDERTIKEWIASGRITGETMIWKSDMAAWQEARVVRPQWFASVRNDARSNAQVSVGQAASWDTVSLELELAKPWVIMLAVTGLIAVVIGFFAFTISFFQAVLSPYSAAFKLCAVLATLSQMVMCLLGVWLCAKLLKYSSLLSEVGYRKEPEAVNAAVRCLGSAWRLASFVFLAWVVVSVLGLLFTVLAWRFEPTDEEASSSFSSPAVEPPVLADLGSCLKPRTG